MNFYLSFREGGFWVKIWEKGGVSYVDVDERVF